ncbi:MAG TPA: hypothetical protein VGF45_01955 [Polyangia bacterium]
MAALRPLYRRHARLVDQVVTKEVVPMSEPGQRKVFNTVESNFLEAGEQMDLAAATAKAEADESEDEPARPSFWARFVTLAFGRWGAVALVGTGAFVIGGASFRTSPGSDAVTTTLAVETTAAHAASALPLDPIARETAAPLVEFAPSEAAPVEAAPGEPAPAEIATAEAAAIEVVQQEVAPAPKARSTKATRDGHGRGRASKHGRTNRR